MAHAPAEFSFHGRELKREAPIVEPLLLNACAVVHLERAQQLPGFGPLSADAVKQPVQVRVLRRQLAVLMPCAQHAVNLAFENVDFPLNLAVPIKKSLDV